MKKDYAQYFQFPSFKEAAKRSKEKVAIIRDSLVIHDNLKTIVRGKHYFIATFGCQANERDEEIIAGILETIGYVRTTNQEDADLIILNTCAVRENAEDRVFGELGHLKGLKQKNNDLIIGICGCMIQQEEIINRILQKYHQVDLIFGTHNLASLPKLLEDIYLYHKQKVVEVHSIEGSVYENLPSQRNNHLKAWVNIMYGCDKFCTYCIVPYTRGKERSRLREDILLEVENLKNEGYLEITLLGQNVNAYGKDLKLGYDFGDLLIDVAKTNFPRIRFTTSHPWDFTSKMVDAMHQYPNIMPHVHLPLQSGDDDVLRRMGRRYTYEHYYNLYQEIRSKIEGVSITTDIIVGFPNESDGQFDNTMKAMQECIFDGTFTFIFSPRGDTPAAKMVDEVSIEVKKERFNRLLEVVATSANQRNQAYLGRILKVLVEGYSKKNDQILSGYSEENKVVNFVGTPDLIGKIVRVKITKVKSWTLEGEYTNE